MKLIIFILFTDMINIIKLDFVPSSACWIHSKGDPIHTVVM